ncbi:MAG TPA: isochorismate synthase [Gemmatimonadaceae bacterium]|nr:isochorismate synthase [Gemmatimonadaceae bacterium]
MTDFNLKIDRSRFDALLATARERARALNRPVLVALTQLAPTLDPLSALESVSQAASSNSLVASQVAEGRMFWACPRDGFSLAGIGAVAAFSPEGPDRFASVDSAWSALLEGAVTQNPDEGTPGLGPVLMGGFAFDGDTRQSGLWKGFSSAHMIVPRLLFTATGEKSWLTVSAIVGTNGEPDVDLETLTSLLGETDGVTLHRDNSIIDETAPGALQYTESRSARDWQSLVSTAVREICAGEMQKVVLARDVHETAAGDIDVFGTLDDLRNTHRNSFVFGYWRGESAFIGASPERLVRLDGQDVRASSLAGTEKRGATPEEDSALAALLLASAKDLAEHAAVRDALYDALSEISDDVEAAETPSLLTLPHLHHLHTPVRARLREGHSLLDVVSRLHPTPAVGGTPRDAALRFIKDHEQLDRGWYAAPIGWIGRESGEFAVALRSAVIAGPEVRLFAGCGIVADSDPELEYKESVLKLRPMQLAISAAIAEAGEDLSELGATADVSR